ncbi:Outer membrane assembly lipoprotein YfgL [Candidatus Glomeribacter gigasporarum BEG34]|uniref:Outer membrane protein assembly factor BamB n=1 Tax=Candidatus Glomeribacter gigasporarum BEG34 TaxID=1070319 RepID=G2JA93_9BURK|nr:Outer membrane assembly lipoprotein YfgL [Candidatus Glomeribacter gigasporarum BEG34]
MHSFIRLKRFVLFAVSVGCAALLAACASPDSRRVPAPLTEFKPSLELKQAWKTNIGNAKPYLFRPAVVDNAVYAAAANGAVVKMDASRGAVIWRARLNTKLSAGVGSDGAHTAVGSVDGQVYVLGREGQLLWKKGLKGEIITPPLVGRSVVVARTNDGRITAFDAQTGARKWTFWHEAAPLSLRITEDMVFADAGLVLAGFPDGALAAIRLADGAAQWQSPVSYPRGVTDSERMNDVAGAPVRINREICAVTFQGSISCMEVQTGQVLWEQPLSSYAGLAQYESKLIAVDERAVISLYDTASRQRIWKNAQLKNRALSAPAIAGLEPFSAIPNTEHAEATPGKPLKNAPAVVAGDYKGFVHFLSLQNGELIARAKTDGSAITAPLYLQAVL